MRAFRLGALLLALIAVACLPTTGAPRKRQALTVAQIAKKARPAVVTITTYDAAGKELGSGTGFFVSNQGGLITCWHVLAGANRAVVITSDGNRWPVRAVVAGNKGADLVKVMVDIGGGVAKELVRKAKRQTPYLRLNAKIPDAGSKIVVVGNPLGLLTGGVTDGIVSAVRKAKGYGTLIQFTAPVSPGSSGSPLLDDSGRVIGIVDAIIPGGQNLNFAVHIRAAMTMSAHAPAVVADWSRNLIAQGTKQNGAVRKPGQIAINPVDGAKMVYVPPGEFLMGTDKTEIDALWRRFGWKEEWKKFAEREAPMHRVRLTKGYWMYQHEVTVAQFRKFCQSTGRQMPQESKLWKWQDNHPIVNVSWEDAQAYCQWAGVRLPTEAEWEYAARGGHSGISGQARQVFVWGNDLPVGKAGVGNVGDDRARAKYGKDRGAEYFFTGYDDGYLYTAPVGRYQPNGYGLHDMAGNVDEWCSDWYGEDYYRQSPAVDPRGPVEGRTRMRRGGSWFHGPSGLRVAKRRRDIPDFGSAPTGFVRRGQSGERTVGIFTLFPLVFRPAGIAFFGIGVG